MPRFSIPCRPRWRTCATVLATVLAGCATAPPEGPSALPVPEAFREGADGGPAGASGQPADGWWQVFADAQLDALVARAAQGNPGLQQAAARSAQARAALQAAAAEAWPTVAADIGAARQTGALVNAAGDRGSLFTADLALRYDLDLARRHDRAGQAAQFDLQARRALEREQQVALQAELARAWLQWRALQLERPLLQQLVEADRALVLQVERRVASGLATLADLGPARERQRNDEAELLRLERQQALTLHALAALTGESRLALEAGTSAELPPLPRVPAGLPATMLQRRADVAAADASLQAARLRLGLARDAWFPQLTLTASAGLASADLGQWLKAAARSTGLGLLLALPVFDGGRADAARQAAQADLALAAAEHRERVLAALREVDDQLATLRTLAAEAQGREAALADARSDAARAASRRANGLAAETEGLLARRLELRQQRALLQTRLAQRQATVALVRALGGGWGPAAPRVALNERGTP